MTRKRSVKKRINIRIRMTIRTKTRIRVKIDKRDITNKEGRLPLLSVTALRQGQGERKG
jgi:hypothetical protein